jgi:hypothetical protein
MSANPEAAAPRLRTVREAWLGRAIERLQADPAISAAGLVGSLGRGDADDWSDVDLLIVVPDDQVGHYPDATQLPRPDLVTWSIDARHNAPRGASAIGIDYGIDGLPLHVDWYVYRAPRSPGSQTPGSSSTSRASGAWTRLGQVHVLLDASASRPCRSGSTPATCTHLAAAGARPAGPSLFPASGDVVEVERTVDASGNVSLGERILSAGLPQAGQRVTLLLDGPGRPCPVRRCPAQRRTVRPVMAGPSQIRCPRDPEVVRRRDHPV